MGGNKNGSKRITDDLCVIIDKSDKNKNKILKKKKMFNCAKLK